MLNFSAHLVFLLNVSFLQMYSVYLVAGREGGEEKEGQLVGRKKIKEGEKERKECGSRERRRTRCFGFIS